jgi:hypothetical protein
MPWWIVAAALGSIALTALLTFVLWRINAPLRERGESGGDSPALVVETRAGEKGNGTFDGAADGGGDAGGE